MLRKEPVRNRVLGKVPKKCSGACLLDYLHLGAEPGALFRHFPRHLVSDRHFPEHFFCTFPGHGFGTHLDRDWNPWRNRATGLPCASFPWVFLFRFKTKPQNNQGPSVRVAKTLFLENPGFVWGAPTIFVIVVGFRALRSATPCFCG